MRWTKQREQEAVPYERDETLTEQLDRHWLELLQELRVTQTGVQLLTGFLLSLPFQQRFTTLTDTQRGVYLAVVVLALVATGLLLAPVAIHRIVFRQHERRELVRSANVLALCGLAALGLAITGVALLIFDVVVGPVAGYVFASVVFTGLGALWVVGPLRLRRRARSRNQVAVSRTAGPAEPPA